MTKLLWGGGGVPYYNYTTIYPKIYFLSLPPKSKKHKGEALRKPQPGYGAWAGRRPDLSLQGF